MSKQRLTARYIALPLTVICAAIVVACTPPMPPDVLAARAEAQIECQPGELKVSVPEEFAGSMAAVGMALGAVCPDQVVTEVASSEAAPAALIDAAPTEQELASFATARCLGDAALAVPAFAYPVSLAYNIIGLDGLTITPAAMAGILNGSISSFEDPLITEANAGFDLSGLPPITVLGLAEPQGAVEAMTTWLTQQDPQAWPSGVSGTLTAATPMATTTDLMAELTLAEGNVAVLPVFQALNNVIPAAVLPVAGVDVNGVEFDTVVSPDDVQLSKVGSGATVIDAELGTSLLIQPAVGGLPSPGTFDLAASKIVLGEGQPLVGWPVLGYAHLIVCDSAQDPLPLSFAQYLVRLAGQGALESFGVTPLPEPIRVRNFLPLRVTVSTGSPSPAAS